MQTQHITLLEFIKQWETEYQFKAQKLPIFQPEFAKQLTLEQKQKLILTFYHLRGEFYKFLWYLGSFAPNNDYKQVVLSNIKEELGNSSSHEEWYLIFGNEFGVDCKQEILDRKYRFEWVNEFNKKHLEYILLQDWSKSWSAFGAYEKLDNVDYENLYNLASNIGTSKKGLIFFDIHLKVKHYESIDPLLQVIWNKDPESVQAGFSFITNHQLQMWQDLGNSLLVYDCF